MNLEGTYKIDKVTGQIILELVLRPEKGEEFAAIAESVVGGIQQCQVAYHEGDDTRLEITLGLLPIEETEFTGGPTAEEIAAEFQNMQGEHS